MKTKQCCHCKKVKNIALFNKQSKSKDGLQPRCKVCHGLHNKNHYQQNKDLYLDRAKNSRKRLREWFIDLKKELQCELCSEEKYWRLAFHHPDPTVKEHNVSHLVGYTHSKQKILDEISKCKVVCHNCHADIHHEINNG